MRTLVCSMLVVVLSLCAAEPATAQDTDEARRSFYAHVVEMVKASGEESRIANHPTQHGFVVSGLDTIFLNHLAVFSEQNHMYQLILQVSLPEAALRTYVEDRRQHPDEVYILGNSQWDLMTLPQITTEELGAFTGDLFRGLPADPNTTPPLVHDLRVTIDRIVYFRHFDYVESHPPVATYVLFGAGEEAHLAHRMTRAPDYQQVLDLAELPDWIPPVQLQSAVEINFPSIPYEGTTPCSNPLTEPGYEVTFAGQTHEVFEVAIGTSFYFDTEGLNHPRNPCGDQTATHAQE